jgi:tetratricopeptide (TPR) repeat protein
MHLLTTVGLLGLSLFGWLIVTMIKVAKTDLRSTQIKAIKFVAFGLLFFLFLLPGTYLIFFTLGVTLLLWGIQVKLAGGTKGIDLHLDDMDNRHQVIKRIAIYAPAVILIVLCGGSLYFSGRAYAGELTFKRSLDAAAKNDGLNTYNLQREAILQNPLLPRYRRAYSATNLALANSIASNANLTDQDKQNIAQLIQQSIREAKVAVTLEPANTANWENLTLVYRSLINAAQGADQWTIAALSQAIMSDPVNPGLRIDLGGVYYSLGKYDQAIRLFQQATELKPNYGNAFYNLSHAYLMKKEITSAYDNMSQTLSLTQADSADYTKAKGELEELSKQLPKTATPTEAPAPANGELQAPSPAPSPAAPVALPTGSGPENATTTTP